MKNVCTSNFNSFQSLFEKFDSCDANEDYDRFCDITKQNEKRKALSKFLMICVEFNIIEIESMEKIVLDFISKINILIDKPGNENAVDEIVANLAIMILSSVSVFERMKSHDKIFKDIEVLSELNVKEHPSLSNKTLFKFLDIVEELEDDSSDDE